MQWNQYVPEKCNESSMLISIAWCWKLCDTIKSWKFSSRVTTVQWLRCSIYRYAYSSNNTEILPVFIERKNARWYYQQSKAVRRWFKGFTKVTTFYLWPHRFHAGRQVSSVLFKESASITIWSHYVKFIVYRD